MVEFLDTNATSSELSKMVSNSKERLYLISPYLQMSDKIKILILQAEKASPKIEIKLLYRSDKNKELNDKDTDFLLKQLNNAKVYVLENLHAKCYLNENTAIITSMNLYQHSQENNWETGIKIDKLIDPIVYEDINRHICLLFNVSKRLETNQNNFGSVISQFNDTCTKTKKDDKIAAPNNGYCLRCGKEIDYNRDKPLCFTCFKSWSRYMDESYQENYCHYCGEVSETSFSKPLCVKCYKEMY